MRLIIQRSKNSKVTINGKIKGKIDKGYVVLVGFTHTDNIEIIKKMVDKLINLRIFEDEKGLINLSLIDTGGEILSISQFTLYANTKNGRRPSFTDAMKPDEASKLYDIFNDELRKTGVKVETGIFGADMKVEIYNDGPVTIVLDSKELFNM